LPIMTLGAPSRMRMERPIKTRRLVLRPLGEADAPEIARLAGDWDVARMTGRIAFPYSEELARAWMNTIGDGEFVRAVAYQDRLIGAVGYVEDDNGSAEIGYWIGKPWWGQGFATEAASALIDHCFTTAGLSRLTCCHFIDNTASKRVIEKLGFAARRTTSAWCDARQEEVEALTYELTAPPAKRRLLATLKSPFGRRRAS